MYDLDPIEMEYLINQLSLVKEFTEEAEKKEEEYLLVSSIVEKLEKQRELMNQPII